MIPPSERLVPRDDAAEAGRETVARRRELFRAPEKLTYGRKLLIHGEITGDFDFKDHND